MFRAADGRDVEVRPQLVSFGGHEGQTSSPPFDPNGNSPVRAAFQKVIDIRTTGSVFDYSHWSKRKRSDAKR